jgi:hypothetical protein
MRVASTQQLHVLIDDHHIIPDAQCRPSPSTFHLRSILSSCKSVLLLSEPSLHFSTREVFPPSVQLNRFRIIRCSVPTLTINISSQIYPQFM